MGLKFDYRNIIRQEFMRRKNINPHYSLRQYAKDLNVKPMHMSYLLRGQRGLSKRNAMLIAGRIGMPWRQKLIFKWMVSAQSGRSLMERNGARMWLKRNLVEAAQFSGPLFKYRKNFISSGNLN